ncbi:CD99 antigen-like protein 2 isoform X5 [Onychomys torridus]|uniref:CD99 antigen-like protein 2 isoform X5 n=1 Tax=Onychomys torridus TaxID=38674 RepID=UPI00167F8897|nr:CD99 antigen-like protein 2 isoform X5 [Onychomys torridus]
MVAWRTTFLVCLVFSLATLVQRGSNFDLIYALSDGNDGHQKPSTGARGRWDHVTTTTTRRPGTTRAPSNPVGLSDKDLEDILGGGGYKPDKNKGGGDYGSNDDSGSGMSTETGTIAGVASALAMALIGAVSSYISYQQKKFCFSIQHAAEGQEGLNADYVKGENLEAVVCEEPQVTYSKQEMQSAEPPPPEPPRI